MILQQAIQKEAEKSALENSDGCREGAHCFDCFCRAHEEGFIAAASWVIEQYRPLMEALGKYLHPDKTASEENQRFIALKETFYELIDLQG